MHRWSGSWKGPFYIRLIIWDFCYTNKTLDLIQGPMVVETKWFGYTLGSALFSSFFSFFSLFLKKIVCLTGYFVFSIAVLPHSPGVVYYHLLLRRETRIPEVAPFSFQIGIWNLFVRKGQKCYTPTAFANLWTTPEVRCIIHVSS